MTTYLILVSQPMDEESNESWIIGDLSGIQAHSAKHAISQFVKEQEVTGGVFVAVPARSWIPVTVETETQTKIKLS